MPDNKNIRNPIDNKMIDINDPKEIWNWRKSFNCTEEELIEAVEAVGPSSEKVEEYFIKMRADTSS